MFLEQTVMGAIHNTHGEHSAQHLKTHTEDVREGEGGERPSYILENRQKTA